MNFFNLNKKILVILGLVLLFLIIFIVTLLRIGSKTGPLPTPTTNPFIQEPVDDQKIVISPNISGITPENGTILTPGKPQEFIIKFDQPVDLNSIFIKIAEKDIVLDSAYQIIEFKSEVTDSNQTLIILTDSAIKPFYNYNLTINLASGEKILQITYVSDRNEVSKESENNLTLRQFLPFEDPAFTLSYVPDKNIYVFSFNYNERSNEPLESQFDKAKLAAEEFIRSKGFEPNELKIEWRYR